MAHASMVYAIVQLVMKVPIADSSSARAIAIIMACATMGSVSVLQVMRARAAFIVFARIAVMAVVNVIARRASVFVARVGLAQTVLVVLAPKIVLAMVVVPEGFVNVWLVTRVMIVGRKHA